MSTTPPRFDISRFPISSAMEVLLFLTCFCLASAEYMHDLGHIEAFVQQRKHMLKRKYRPIYHISPPSGWLNGPNGFTYYGNLYHMFYQYHPYRGAWGPIQWGHVVSKNLVDWIHYPPALIPRESYEEHGCLAGSALVHNNYLTLFYTGNVIGRNVSQTQNIALSSDGFLFQKLVYNPIIKQSPFAGTGDFKNPKVWKYRTTWHMILGSTSRERHGQLILYTSPDMFNWSLEGIIAQSYGDMGHTWESPDLFELNGQHILLLSVQGMITDGYRFRNLYQTGYVVTNFNYRSRRFEELEISMATYHELDYGHDFYAAQTMLARDGRRLLVGWLGMWEANLLESKSGWAGLMTMVREIRLTSTGRLSMTPVREATLLRAEVLENAWYSPGESFHAGTKTFEMIVNSSTAVSGDVSIAFEWSNERQFLIYYSHEHGYISVDRGGFDGERRVDWHPNGRIHWRIFVDSSSIELFCGTGDAVFSSRIYPRIMQVRIGGDTHLHITQYRMRRSVGFDRKVRQYLKDIIMNNQPPKYA